MKKFIADTPASTTTTTTTTTSNISHGPTFNCDVDQNRTLGCSLIKLCDIVCDDQNDDNDESFTSNAKTLIQHLSKSFNYLPKCDLKCLILGSDTYLERFYKFSATINNGIPCITLFDCITIPVGAGNDGGGHQHNSSISTSTSPVIISRETISVLFAFAKKHINELRSSLSISSDIDQNGTTYHQHNRQDYLHRLVIDDDDYDRYGGNGGEQHYTKLRSSVSLFLNFLKRYLYLVCGQNSSAMSTSTATVTNTCSVSNVTEHINTTNTTIDSMNLYHFCSFVLTELRQLLIFSGRLNQFGALFHHHSLISSSTSATDTISSFATTTNANAHSSSQKTNISSPFIHKSDCNSALYNYYHTVLEIWWSTVEITYLIQVIYNGNGSGTVTSSSTLSTTVSSKLARFNFVDIYLICEDLPSSLFNCSNDVALLFDGSSLLFGQTIRMLLFDLLCLSKNRFEPSLTSTSHIDHHQHYRSPFVCTCDWEIWIMARMLLTQGIANTRTTTTHGNQDDVRDNNLTKHQSNISLNPFFTILFDTVVSQFNHRKINNENEDQDHDVKMTNVDIHFDNFGTSLNPSTASNTFTSTKSFYLYHLWLFANISPLLPLDISFANRLLVTSSFSVTMPLLMVKIYRSILKDCEHLSTTTSTSANESCLERESILHTVLMLTFKCTRHLGTLNFDILSLLVEHFLKRLNTNLQLGTDHHTRSTMDHLTTSIKDYSFMPQSSLKWLEMISNSLCGRGGGGGHLQHSRHRRLLNVDFPTHIGMYNNFQLFLLLLAYHFVRLFRDDNCTTSTTEANTKKQQLQKIFSKIIITLQPRTLKQLKPIGVYNLATIYLVICRTVPLDRWIESMLDKMLYIFSELIKCGQSGESGVEGVASGNSVGTILELIIKYHFAILHLINDCTDDSNGEINIDSDDRSSSRQHRTTNSFSSSTLNEKYKLASVKVAQQLTRCLERITTMTVGVDISAKQSSYSININNRYHSLVRLYFEEIQNLICVHRQRSLSMMNLSTIIAHSTQLFHYFRSLLIDLQWNTLYHVIQSTSNSRRSSSGSAVRHHSRDHICLLLDTINEMLQFGVKILTTIHTYHSQRKQQQKLRQKQSLSSPLSESVRNNIYDANKHQQQNIKDVDDLFGDGLNDFDDDGDHHWMETDHGTTLTSVSTSSTINVIEPQHLSTTPIVGFSNKHIEDNDHVHHDDMDGEILIISNFIHEFNSKMFDLLKQDILKSSITITGGGSDEYNNETTTIAVLVEEIDKQVSKISALAFNITLVNLLIDYDEDDSYYNTDGNGYHGSSSSMLHTDEKRKTSFIPTIQAILQGVTISATATAVSNSTTVAPLSISNILFQLYYIDSLLQHSKVLRRLKQCVLEEITNQSTTNVIDNVDDRILMNDTNVCLLSTWCRLLPSIALSCDSLMVKLGILSRVLFDDYFCIQQMMTSPQLQHPPPPTTTSTVDSSSTSNSSSPNPINYFKQFLRHLQNRYHQSYCTSVMNTATMAYRTFIAKLFTPLILECRQIFFATTLSITRKNQLHQVQQQKITLWLITYLVCHCAPQLYQPGRVDCSMAIILEYLLLIPQSLMSSTTVSTVDSNVTTIDRTIIQCFPLLFDGICQLTTTHSTDVYLQRKSRQMVVNFLPLLTRTGITYERWKTIFTSKHLCEKWSTIVGITLEKYYLIQRDLLPLMSKQMCTFFTQYIRLELNTNELLHLCSVLPTITLTEFTMKDYRSTLWQVVMFTTVERITTDDDRSVLAKQYIDTVIIPFIRAHIHNRPVRMFELLKYLLPPTVHRTAPVVFHELCGELNRLFEQVERNANTGSHKVLRKLFKDFIINYEQSSV